MSADEKRHLSRVAAIGCIACQRVGLGPTPAQVHHIRTGQGMGQRASHFLTIPLCPEHHTGGSGIHRDPRRFADQFGSELDLLAATIRELGRA